MAAIVSGRCFVKDPYRLDTLLYLVADALLHLVSSLRPWPDCYKARDNSADLDERSDGVVNND